MKNPVKFRSLFGGGGGNNRTSHAPRKSSSEDYPMGWSEPGDMVRPVHHNSDNVRMRANTMSESDALSCRKEIVKIIQTPKLQR